ncbi:MAG: hypothetical protein AB7P04_03650 [Bacteriovoracia bacterium]
MRILTLTLLFTLSFSANAQNPTSVSNRTALDDGCRSLRFDAESACQSAARKCGDFQRAKQRAETCGGNPPGRPTTEAACGSYNQCFIDHAWDCQYAWSSGPPAGCKITHSGDNSCPGDWFIGPDNDDEGWNGEGHRARFLNTLRRCQEKTQELGRRCPLEIVPVVPTCPGADPAIEL